jgi:hypothetical protein
MKKLQLKELIKEEIKKILEISEEKPEEKINTGLFNEKLKDFYLELRSNKIGISTLELQNILDLIGLLVLKARESSLTQAQEDRIKLILDPNNRLSTKKYPQKKYQNHNGYFRTIHT